MKNLLLSLTIMALLSACATQPRGFPAHYGINNFDRVTSYLYRGAQPDRIGIELMRKQCHVSTVINLRGSDRWDTEQQACTENGINYISIPLSGTTSPKASDIEKILAIISQAKQTGAVVFVHCQYGCDRTGTVVACARIRLEGCSNEEALKEAKIYGMSTFEFCMEHFVEQFK